MIVFYYVKGGNPKGAFSDDVVTYWNFDEFIEIYIHTRNEAKYLSIVSV